MNKEDRDLYLWYMAKIKAKEKFDDINLEKASKESWVPEMFQTYCTLIFAMGYAEGYAQCASDVANSAGPFAPDLET